MESLRKFDVVVSNPPYQVGNNKKSEPIYPYFYYAGKIIAKNISMVFPSTWHANTSNLMTEFREFITTKDTGIENFETTQLFDGIDISSGVAIVTSPVKNKQNHNIIDGYYIKDVESFNIINKIDERGNFNFFPENKFMVIVGESNGAALKNNRIISEPVIVSNLDDSPYSNPQILYSSDNYDNAVNAVNFWKTKFVRFLIKQLKTGHHQTLRVFGFIPEVDFTKYKSDQQLYKKYNLTSDEIAFVEKNIKEMN